MLSLVTQTQLVFVCFLQIEFLATHSRGILLRAASGGPAPAPSSSSTSASIVSLPPAQTAYVSVLQTERLRENLRENNHDQDELVRFCKNHVEEEDHDRRINRPRTTLTNPRPARAPYLLRVEQDQREPPWRPCSEDIIMQLDRASMLGSVRERRSEEALGENSATGGGSSTTAPASMKPGSSSSSRPASSTTQNRGGNSSELQQLQASVGSTASSSSSKNFNDQNYQHTAGTTSGDNYNKNNLIAGDSSSAATQNTKTSASSSTYAGTTQQGMMGTTNHQPTTTSSSSKNYNPEDRGTTAHQQQQNQNQNQNQIQKIPNQPGGGTSSGGKQELSSYAFFAKYTYTTECALLAYNFHEIVNQLGIFEFFTYKHDHRLVSVTLAYLFYKYQIHHCDMALDLALTLTYLEDLSATELLEFQDGDAFNVICYLAFLAHVFNADRTIRLKDWYHEIGWRHFSTLKKLNAFVFFLFSKVRKFKLQVSESRVKKYIQKLCSVPAKAQQQG
ncbi:unnamed protein product [Amoebophrya sp. A120]|nr:unnamed protein product [Amoebophrya sp. A120]|eukprot:GSA120T00008039001.1